MQAHPYKTDGLKAHNVKIVRNNFLKNNSIFNTFYNANRKKRIKKSFMMRE